MGGACGMYGGEESTLERVEEFKYLGTTLKNQNSIAEEIRAD